jgi:hypothetical protein
MTPKKPTNFRIDTELLDGLEELRVRELWGVSWQVREAIKDWLRKNDVKVKTERKRASTRKRP